MGCAIFPILQTKRAVTVARKQKYEQNAQNLLQEVRNAVTQFCTGKNKLICPVIRDIKKYLLMSLEPGHKQSLINYLKRAKRTFCRKNPKQKRCAVLSMFAQRSQSAFFPKAKVLGKISTGHATRTVVSTTDRDATGIAKLAEISCSKPGFEKDCMIYKEMLSHNSLKSKDSHTSLKSKDGHNSLKFKDGQNSMDIKVTTHIIPSPKASSPISRHAGSLVSRAKAMLDVLKQP